jgi:hypothetical protein
MAKWMNRVSTVRTLTHEWPIHGVAFALTGTGRTDLALLIAVERRGAHYRNGSEKQRED